MKSEFNKFIDLFSSRSKKEVEIFVYFKVEEKSPLVPSCKKHEHRKNQERVPEPIYTLILFLSRMH